MHDDSSALASCLGHFAVSMDIVPFQCPQEFGKDSRYVLHELIAFGPRSWVYKAKDSALSNGDVSAWVAIKIERERGAAGEAVTARRILNDHVVRVHDAGVTHEGHAYTVMELVEGGIGDLSKTRVPWDPRRAAGMVRDLAAGVQAAHSAGVIHCDIKPTNVLLDSGGRPKLADFNLAVDGLLGENSIRGNIAFMAPEQLAGRAGALAPAADVFALGGMLYWLLTGKPPRENAASGVPTELPPGIPRPLAAICLRAMAIDKSSRYQTAESLAVDLDRWLRHFPIEWMKPGLLARTGLWARRRPAVTTALLSCVLIGVAVVVPMRQRFLEERQREQEKLAYAESEVQKYKERAKLPILMAGRALTSIKNGRRAGELVPALNWVEWLARQSLLYGDDARMVSTEVRSIVLNDYLGELRRQKQEDSVACLAVQLALAQTYLLMRRTDQAAEVVGELQARWNPRLDAGDHVRRQIELVHQVCDAASLQDEDARVALVMGVTEDYLNQTKDAMLKDYIGLIRQIYGTPAAAKPAPAGEGAEQR